MSSANVIDASLKLEVLKCEHGCLGPFNFGMRILGKHAPFLPLVIQADITKDSTRPHGKSLMLTSEAPFSTREREFQL